MGTNLKVIIVLDVADNKLKTIIEFEVYLKELKDGVSEERRQELRNISTSTSDLINYSWEVVDTQDLRWKQLIKLVDEVATLSQPV